MTRARTLRTMTLIATAFQVVAVLASHKHKVFFGTVGRAAFFADVRIYFGYASKAMAGMVPYRDYLIEYPILAFPFFVIPKLFGTTYWHYRVAFGVEMLLINAATVYLVARRVEQTEGMDKVPGRLAWYSAFFACFCPLAMARFDIVPMALTFMAALAWFSGRSASGGALTALGTLVKIVPGVVAVTGLVWELARLKVTRGRGLATLAGGLAVGAAAWLALGGIRVKDSLVYHGERGLEIGSLYSGLSIAWAHLIGVPVATIYLHGSMELMVPWGPALAKVALLAQAGALLLVACRFWRSGLGDPLRYSAAAVLAFIVFGKVLSPQYLIWLFPFVSVLEGWTGSRARWLFLVCCLTTTAVYPMSFNRLLNFEGWAVGFLIYRNALLLGLFSLLLLGPETHQGRTVEPRRMGRSQRPTAREALTP